MLNVRCARPGDDPDDEPRVALVIAPDFAEAEKLCLNEYGGEGFQRFEPGSVVQRDGVAGPARIVGYEASDRRSVGKADMRGVNAAPSRGR